MRDLGVVVESLRLVQRARRRFMELWTLEQDYIIPMLDRMAEDLQGVSAADDAGPAGLNPPAAPDE